MAEGGPGSSTVSVPRAGGRPTRERLLEAASGLFANQGFDATSVDAIAEAAGITASGMYKHFDTKHELLLAVARWSARTSEARQTLADKPDLAVALADLFAEYLEAGQSARRRLSIELSRAAFKDDALQRGVSAFNGQLRDSLARTILRRRPDGDAGEAALLAHLVLVLLMGAIHLDTLDQDRIGDPTLIDFLRDRLEVVLGSTGGDGGRLVDGQLSIALDAPPEPEPSDGRRARAVRTRRRVLDAGHELFALHGYDATTIEMIATRAEITVPGLYRHVTSKEALLVEVAQRAFSRYRLAGELRDEAGVAARLADLLVTFSMGSDRVSRRLAIELDFGAWRSEALADDLTSFHRSVRQNVASSLAAEEGVEAGEDHELRALVLLMLFMGVAHLDTVDPSLVDDPAWMGMLRRRVPQLVGPSGTEGPTGQADRVGRSSG